MAASYVELLAEPEPPLRRNIIDHILNDLPEKDSKALRALLMSRRTADWLSEEMDKRGDKVAPSTITSWRRKQKP